jgi:CYTH domain-containing protein
MIGDNREVERVYLLARMPEIPHEHEVWKIEQGYLVPPPGSTPGSSQEGRVRRTELPDHEVVLTHTIKRGMGLVREEHERIITHSEFEQLWPLTCGRRIRKQRLRVLDNGLVWEIDQFLDLNLVLAEVELPDPGTPVEPPVWLQPLILREVTEDPAFRNYELSRARISAEAEENED